jgi:hypothetical protein
MLKLKGVGLYKGDMCMYGTKQNVRGEMQWGKETNHIHDTSACIGGVLRGSVMDYADTWYW